MSALTASGTESTNLKISTCNLKMTVLNRVMISLKCESSFKMQNKRRGTNPKKERIFKLKWSSLAKIIQRKRKR